MIIIHATGATFFIGDDVPLPSTNCIINNITLHPTFPETLSSTKITQKFKIVLVLLYFVMVEVIIVTTIIRVVIIAYL